MLVTPYLETRANRTVVYDMENPETRTCVGWFDCDDAMENVTNIYDCYDGEGAYLGWKRTPDDAVEEVMSHATWKR